MKLDFPDKEWKEKAPESLRDHKQYAQMRKLLSSLKDTDSLKDETSLSSARDESKQVIGLLLSMFAEVSKKVKPEDRKPYNSLHAKWKEQAEAYGNACTEKIEELKDAKAGVNSEMILMETQTVFKDVEKKISEFKRHSDTALRQLLQVRKDIESAVDRMTPGAKDGYDSIREMNGAQLQARKVAAAIATCALKGQQLVESNWHPMVKDRSGLTKAHRALVDKMTDGIKKSAHQLEHNETEANKLTNGLKQMILQAGAILQGGVEQTEMVTGKLQRLVVRLETSLQECENRYAYDASGRIDACEGDLNNYQSAEGIEKDKWAQEFKRRLQLTRPSLENLANALSSAKKDLDQTMNSFTRDQLDITNPQIKKALEALDERIKFMAEIRKQATSYGQRLEKVTKKAGDLGISLL